MVRAKARDGERALLVGKRISTSRSPAVTQSFSLRRRRSVFSTASTA